MNAKNRAIDSLMAVSNYKTGMTIAAILGVAMLAMACTGGITTPHGSGATATDFALPTDRPVSLMKRHAPHVGESVAMGLPEIEIKRAVDRFRINKGLQESPYQSAGADLDGDGQPEALVFLAGSDWCAPTGCSLLVMKAGDRGYRTVSMTKRVIAPVVIAHTATNGWRDLLAKSGGAGMKMQTVQLKFTGGGYPPNASILTPFLGDAVANGEVIIRGQQARAGNGANASNGASITFQ